MAQGPSQDNVQELLRYHISQQQTVQQTTLIPPSPLYNPAHNTFPNPHTPIPVNIPDQVIAEPEQPKKRKLPRFVAIFIVLGLACAIYFIWHTTPSTTPSPGITQQGFSSSSTPASTTDGIRVYVVGAVKHPGVYTLASGARIYDLLRAAGGTLSNANIVALNLAAKLSDGQEVYVTRIGEAPPTYMGGVSGTGSSTSDTGSQLVNINTASADELSQHLHISKTSAQAIVDYRSQHGNFSSVDELSQVVSKRTYDKIRSQCTV